MFRRAPRWLVLWSLATLSTPVLAQSALTLDRFQPSSPGSALFSVPDTSPQLGSPIRVGWVISYSKAPLIVATTPQGDTPAGNVVDSQALLHWQFSLRPHERVVLDADLPLVHTNRGPLSSTVAAQGLPLPKNGLGDLRLGGVWRIADQGRVLPALGLLGRVWLPTADNSRAQGNPKSSYAVGLVASRDFGSWLFRAEISRLRQWNESILPTALSGFTGSAGIAYRYGQFQVGPEIFGATAATDSLPAWSRRNTNLEGLVGLKYRIAGVELGAAFGPGLAQGAGTPTYRGLFTVSLDPAMGQAPAKRVAAKDSSSSSKLPLGDSAKAPPSMARANLAPDCAPADPNPLCSLARANEQDRDHDQIADNADACPTVRGVANNLATKHGCPADRDDDGIPDDLDACPELKGPPSTDANLNGCQPSIQITEHSLAISQQIQFATGGDIVLRQSEPILQDLATLMQEHPEITRVAVDGHTDNVGSDSRNLALSRRRAVAVVRWLVAHGVDERRLEARGYGSKQPLETNDTEAGRHVNRRVEFVIRKRSPRGADAWQDGAQSE